MFSYDSDSINMNTFSGHLQLHISVGTFHSEKYIFHFKDKFVTRASTSK